MVGVYECCVDVCVLVGLGWVTLWCFCVFRMAAVLCVEHVAHALLWKKRFLALGRRGVTKYARLVCC